MTSVTQSLGALGSHTWEKTALAAARLLLTGLSHMLRGAGLGLVGLAVVTAATAALIGVHELGSEGLPSLLPPEIRLH
ncbi:hypothetical protein ACFL6X_00795 [Candidatus Latescibacterota bacterium]